MRKILLLTLTLLLIAACKNSPQYTISGNCGGCNDTLYLFGLDKEFDKIEKFTCDGQGSFSHSIETSKALSLLLALPTGDLITLYGEPGLEATLIADSIKGSGWIVKGGREQTLYDSIANILKKLDSNSERVVHIDNFIKENPFSHTNIEIIRRFMVEVPNPNQNFIKQRISNLGGTLQDHEYFAGLKNDLNTKNRSSIHKLLPAFEFTTDKGETVSQKTYKGKLLIINFWAAWDSVSRAALKEQGKLYAACDTSNIKILNISLDYDTAVWRKSIASDSIAGDNVCDGRMWDNELAKNFSIARLPFTISVSPYQRIEMFDIENERFASTADSLCNKHFNKKKGK